MFNMNRGEKKENLIQRFGKWGPIIAFVWVGSHVVVPLVLLRIPVFQKYLISFLNKMPFEIPGIG